MSGSHITEMQAFEAAKLGNREVVDAYLSAGHDVNELGDDGTTLLFHSALNGRLDLVRYLVNEKSADIDIVYTRLQQYPGQEEFDPYEALPLLGMCIHLEMNDVAKCLCDLSANVNSVEYASSAFYVACEYENVEMMNYLFDRYGADVDGAPYVDQFPIYSFAERNNLSLVKWMLAKGASVIDDDGDNLFLRAVIVGNVEMMQLAYDRLPEIDLAGGTAPEFLNDDWSCESSMKCAFKSHSLPAVGWLLEKGVTPDKDDLLLDVPEYSPQMLEILLPYLADEEGDLAAMFERFSNAIIEEEDNAPLLAWFLERIAFGDTRQELAKRLLDIAASSVAADSLTYLLDILGLRKAARNALDPTLLSRVFFNEDRTGLNPASYHQCIETLIAAGAPLYAAEPSGVDSMSAFISACAISAGPLRLHMFNLAAAVSGYQFSDHQVLIIHKFYDSWRSRMLGSNESYIQLRENRWVHPDVFSRNRIFERLKCIGLFEAAWRTYQGKLKSKTDELPGVHPDHKKLFNTVATISQRRICRTIKQNGVNQPIEPLGRDVIRYLGALPIHEIPTRD